MAADQIHASRRRPVPDALAVRTVPVPDPGDLLPLLAEPAALAWLHHGEGLVGWGEAARVVLPAGVDRFAAGEKWLRAVFEAAEIEDQVGLPGCGPVAFGSYTFDPASEGSVVVIPRAVAGRRDGQAWLTTIGGEAGPPAGPVPVQPVAGPVRWHDGTLTALEWQQAVAAAVVRIRAGALRKVVLARDLFATAADPFDVRVLLGRLAGRYPDCYTFSCAGLVGATPELLIRREEQNVSSLVLAGTVPRGSTLAEDRAYGDGLLASAKDAEEHAYVVDSVRDVLARHCDRLEVAAAPSLLRLANLQHLATAVTGRLAADASALALAAELHPTAAVCGTPADAALELIRELEGVDRGRYAGPVGWLDARGNGEWGIALRCAELDRTRARLFAGSGIVAGSDPRSELTEDQQPKFRPMQYAIEG
ncbi:MAG TPA: isochorismate synthase [Streptosporangiaceae bacterium]|nr:isochorismate synthase [Streptosporangiaceae bacterium]